MATKGFKYAVSISGDGGVNFYDVGEVTSLSISSESETEDVTTHQDNGFKREDITITGMTISIEGFRNLTNTAQGILRKNLDLKQSVIFKAYQDKTDVTQYVKGSAIVSSFENSGEVGGYATYSVELPVQGAPEYVGYTN